MAGNESERRAHRRLGFRRGGGTGVDNSDVLEGSGEGDCMDELWKVTSRLMVRGAMRGRPGLAGNRRRRSIWASGASDGGAGLDLLRIKAS
jgi:hypothetical protein